MRFRVLYKRIYSRFDIADPIMCCNSSISKRKVFYTPNKLYSRNNLNTNLLFQLEEEIITYKN